MLFQVVRASARLPVPDCQAARAGAAVTAEWQPESASVNTSERSISREPEPPDQKA